MRFRLMCFGLFVAIFGPTAGVIRAETPAGVEDRRIPIDTKPRAVFFDKSPTRATCFGSRVTPECAIETTIACWVRDELDLCRASYVLPADHQGYFAPPINYDYYFRSKKQAGAVFYFNFTERKPLDRTDYEFYRKYPDQISKPLLETDEEISGTYIFCKSEEADCFRRKRPLIWFVRRTEDGWRVVRAHTPPWDDVRYIPLSREWRMIERDSRRASSKCIGSIATPECALDTAYACWLWKDLWNSLDVCRNSGLMPRPHTEDDVRVNYRFLGRAPISRSVYEDSLKSYSEYFGVYRESDEEIHAIQQLCSIDKKGTHCGKITRDITYLRRTEEGWRIIPE